MIAIEIPWGWFADRFGYKKTLLISNVIFFISKIVFYKAFSLIFTKNQVLSVIFIMFVSEGMYLINPILLEIQNKAISTGDRETMSSIYAMVGNIIAAIINPFIRKAADISVQFTFSTCALIAIFGYGFFLIYKRKDQNTNFFFTR